MEDSGKISEVTDFIEFLATDTELPLVSLIGPMPEIGEKDRWGRTLMGYTEIDKSEVQRLGFLWAEAYHRLHAMYHEQGFRLSGDPEHEGYWEPIETPESDELAEETDRLWDAFQKAQRREPIWDKPGIKLPIRMEWGMKSYD